MNDFNAGDNVFYGAMPAVIQKRYSSIFGYATAYDIRCEDGTEYYISTDRVTDVPVESPYTRALHLEAKMDACRAVGDKEGYDTMRALVHAALWDWLQATKRREK